MRNYKKDSREIVEQTQVPRGIQLGYQNAEQGEVSESVEMIGKAPRERQRRRSRDEAAGECKERDRKVVLATMEVDVEFEMEMIGFDLSVDTADSSPPPSTTAFWTLCKDIAELWAVDQGVQSQ